MTTPSSFFTGTMSTSDGLQVPAERQSGASSAKQAGLNCNKKTLGHEQSASGCLHQPVFIQEEVRKGGTQEGKKETSEEATKRQQRAQRAKKGQTSNTSPALTSNCNQ